MQRITLHQGKGRFHQHFYMQLIHTQIQKGQKRLSSHQCLFALLGSACEEKEITHIKAKVTRAHTYTHKRTHIHTRTHAHTRAHTRTHFFSLSLSEREIESYQTRNDAIGLFLLQFLDYIYIFLLLSMVYRFVYDL